MRFWYLLILVYCLKQTSVVNCFDIAGNLISAVDLYKETAKLNSDLRNNIEPLLSTYEEAFEEVSEDFSDKIDPLLKKLGIHFCDRFKSFNTSSKAKNLFKKTLEDFNLSNLTEICSDDFCSDICEFISECDKEESLDGIYNKIKTAYSIFLEYLKNTLSLRTSTANLLYHKANELTKTSLDKVKDFRVKALGGYIDSANSIKTEVFEPLDKCLKLITTRGGKAIRKCVESVYKDMEKELKVKQLKDLEKSKWDIYNELLEQYRTQIDRTITIANTIDNKMLFVSKNILDKFLKDDKSCFGEKFFDFLKYHLTFHMNPSWMYMSNEFYEAESALDPDFIRSVRAFHRYMLIFSNSLFDLNVPLERCSIMEYVGTVRKTLCKVYDKTSFIFDKATNKIMKPIEKIQSFIPCFLKDIGIFVMDKATEFLDEAGIKKIYDDVEKEISNLVDDSVSILKPFFEEFGSGCAKALEAFETSIENLHNDIKKCDFMININQLSDSCSKPSSIENSRFINKKLKELPGSAVQLKACVQEKIAKKGKEIYDATEACKKHWKVFFPDNIHDHTLWF